ncbi:PREDICTED: G protein-activated inward rectifier potassium channel 3-like isoform X1 [Papilio polytes]|uniref:G protein-activated inward rectifier potassium channel 3-like isoform X1 n=1 Tax=Papilio polytes TaxID=76194 RepID=UPI000676ADFC|nr:PREDICTED: G protein-activated inward rectifier potassium channel 3-like isoform X1 [Papilio polytes]
MTTELSYEMQERQNGEKEVKGKLATGKLFYKPGVIEEETDETSAFESSMVESPMIGPGCGSSFLRPPQIHPSSSLHRIPTYSSSIGQSTIYRQDTCRSRSHRHGATRRTRRRAILKNGECNILKSRISQRRLRFLQDMFTTLVDAQWRWTLLVFTLSFILSWLGFALIWWLIAFTHGDLEVDHLPPMQESSNWKPCVFNIYDFTSCFLFSIETQHTIGYGSRTTTEECPKAIFIMCLQSIVGVMIQAFMVGIVFAKMTRPKHRTQTLLFSKYAVVCQRDGELCLMFRVGDLRKSHIIGASVRAQLIRSRTTKEGELLSHYQTELELNADGCDSNLFFIWPITMVHRINAESPFYGVSAADVLQERFEIVVILEGTIESTGQTTQARSSYTTSEIMWGHRFVPLVSYNRERQGYEVDYSKFDETSQVDTPLCSAKELDEFYGNQPDRRSIVYSGNTLPREILYDNGKEVPSSPLINLADRLVVDAIRRASLTNRPSIVKYPPDYFNSHEDHSSSSSEDEKTKKKQGSRKSSAKAV